MQRDLVAFGADLGGQLWPSLHLFTDEEEGRASLRFGEMFEHGRRPLRVGPSSKVSITPSSPPVRFRTRSVARTGAHTAARPGAQ
jgi:hypothetical protein